MSEPVDQWLQKLLQLDNEEEKMTEKQLKIVQAASEIFAEKGFAASSTSEIAQRAGVAEGTIFRHYKTKKDLLFSIVAPVMAKLIAPFVLRDFYKVLESRFDTLDLMLRAIIENRIAFVERHVQVLKIFVQEIPFHPELLDQFQKLILSKVVQKFSISITQFQQQGVIVNWAPFTVIRLIASSLIGYVLSRTFIGKTDGIHWDDDLEKEATITFIIKGLAS
ncbi:TetR/AcrR family transcriptional regulator [Paenibacillus sp. NRS-1760]|uniref:TetR/AcrR family transcriptional regulator n=1 Tax=Paenibacillus sp. NRS-1760 TaxID=3233902 RepID=UPI003D268D35